MSLSNSLWRTISLVICCFLIYGQEAQAQHCSIELNGVVIDHHTGEPMPYVSLYERSIGRGVSTDDDGRFLLDGLCAGDLHLEFSHLGCEPVLLFIFLARDTTITVGLHHNAQLLRGVEIHGGQNNHQQLGAESLSRSDIDADSDEDLTTMLTRISGLSAIQNGSTIAKPVYHGLSGNRLTILNNGIAQSGQQWGSDHAPEIDAYAADRLTVIQGVNTLAQNGPNIGGMIQVEMAPIPKDPHLHGNVNYSFASNGLGHVLNSRLEKSSDWAAWRLTLTAKMSGDRETPDYFLTNTASRQLNGALLMEKDLTTAWRSTLYLSTFNTEIGILRGSHIGNLSDLNEAFDREIPFFTEDSHDYSIDNPRQAVSHHLLKFKNRIHMSKAMFEITYAAQFNARKEFDIRRAGREDQAALDLDQSDHFIETVLKIHPDSALSWRTGVQYRSTRNINDPQSGILPLVPDYLNQLGSAFFIGNWDIERWSLAAGTRVDVKNIYALPISRTLPRVVERKDLWYTAPSAVFTLRYDVNSELKFEGEAAYRQRSPEVNELFSNGLHQGVSGIEEGDEDLENEIGYLSRLTASYHIEEKYFIEATAYHQRIDDFIYLVPQEELRLTIRGAFPVFQYKQVDAIMSGVDLNLAAELGRQWRISSSYSYLKGEEGNGLALVGIPANSGSVRIHYEVEEWKQFEDIHLSLGYGYTASRNDLLTDNTAFPERDADSPLQGQDFVAPPEAYGLVGFEVSCQKQVAKQKINLGIKVSNLLDTRYRDYLDRQRYFADAMGRNIRLRVGWKF